MKANHFNSQELSCLEYTIEHFQEIARQNRFAENSSIDHHADRCVICHAGLIPQDPFLTYLDVVTPSVKARRPTLDQSLVDAINEDLALIGEDFRVSLDALRQGDNASRQRWMEWIRTALATGLGLLSVHSPTSLDFDLDEAEERGMGTAVDEKVQEILRHQLSGGSSE
jgi:hypothetical protein